MAKDPQIIRERAERCVCKMCGGPLEPKIIFIINMVAHG